MKLYQKFIYRFLKTLFRAFFMVFARLKVEGLENIPKNTGVLIVSNHISNMDPPLLGSFINRYIFFFAKEELFKIPIFGWAIRQINAFPVKRGENDIGAFKKALSILKQGYAILLFPEGRRSVTGKIGVAKPGAAMLSIKAGVPILPAHVTNSHLFFKFKKIKITFGKPLRFNLPKNEKPNYEQISTQIMTAIATLKSKDV